MGLYTKDAYNVKGVIIQPAYAKLLRIEIPGNGNLGETNQVSASFGVSTNRENLTHGLTLEEIPFDCTIDTHEDKIFNEIYTKAKQTIFKDWKDDIVSVEEDNVEEEMDINTEENTTIDTNIEEEKEDTVIEE